MKSFAKHIDKPKSARATRLESEDKGVHATSDVICRFAFPSLWGACTRVTHEQVPQSSGKFTLLRGNSMLAGVTSPLVKPFSLQARLPGVL